MTKYEPFLVLRRFVVYDIKGNVAYDENFHDGVNIIRGENSTGKSTIVNMIFFALGGDYTLWTEAAKNCQSVYAEVLLNDNIVTLKRNISVSPKQGMSVFIGDYEMASKSSSENWLFFSYFQTENKKSFSNFLFGLLKFPELKGEAGTNITMHQILRLMYIDQKSFMNSLFRTEQFDSSLTRETVAELLLGVYDDTLYSDRLRFREIDKLLSEKKREYDSITNLYGFNNEEIDKGTIESKMKEIEEQLNLVISSTINLKETSSFGENTVIDLEKKKIKNNILPLRNELNKYVEDKNNLEIDIFDSEEFIVSLEKRLIALEESLAMRNVLEELPLTYCPNCMSELVKSEDEETCFLCKQKLTSNEQSAQVQRMKFELQNQINESKYLLVEKRKKVSTLIALIKESEILLNNYQRDLDILLSTVQSTRNEEIDELLTKRGKLESNLEYLSRQLKMANALEDLKIQLGSLSDKKERLNNQIKLKEIKQKKNYDKAIYEIQTYTLYLLHNDIPGQEEFEKASSIEMSFYDDRFSVNEKSNFSASSNVYLKNALLYSILFASLKLESMRYPRFIMCDNMEDKGMTPERNHNFQKLIVNNSQKFAIQHQIIFTTSHIEPELNNSQYCVGEEYSPNNKTLKLQ